MMASAQAEFMANQQSMMNLMEAFEDQSKGFFADLQCEETCVDNAFTKAYSPEMAASLIFFEDKCCGVVDYIDVQVEAISVAPTTNLVACFMNNSIVSCV
jgi:hypothetical protein